jgi:hypothetical protein
MYLDTGPCWLLCRVGDERSRLHIAVSAMVRSFRFDGMQTNFSTSTTTGVGKWNSLHALKRGKLKLLSFCRRIGTATQYCRSGSWRPCLVGVASAIGPNPKSVAQGAMSASGRDCGHDAGQPSLPSLTHNRRPRPEAVTF